MPIDAEFFHDEPVEVPDQEIRQVERSRFLVAERLEFTGPCKKLVAMGTRQSLNAVLFQNPVEHAASAAIGIRDEYVPELLLVVLNRRIDRVRNLVRGVVQIGRQALDLKMIPAVLPLQGNKFPCQCAACDEQSAGSHACPYDARRCDTRSLATSTAVAASLQ